MDSTSYMRLVLHRDLYNVLLALKSNRPVITDFGKKSVPKLLPEMELGDRLSELDLTLSNIISPFGEYLNPVWLFVPP